MNETQLEIQKFVMPSTNEGCYCYCNGNIYMFQRHTYIENDFDKDKNVMNHFLYDEGKVEGEYIILGKPMNWARLYFIYITTPAVKKAPKLFVTLMNKVDKTPTLALGDTFSRPQHFLEDVLIFLQSLGEHGE